MHARTYARKQKEALPLEFQALQRREQGYPVVVSEGLRQTAAQVQRLAEAVNGGES